MNQSLELPEVGGDFDLFSKCFPCQKIRKELCFLWEISNRTCISRGYLTFGEHTDSNLLQNYGAADPWILASRPKSALENPIQRRHVLRKRL